MTRPRAGDESSVGLLSVGVPGTLAGWCHCLKHYGTMSLAQVILPPPPPPPPPRHHISPPRHHIPGAGDGACHPVCGRGLQDNRLPHRHHQLQGRHHPPLPSHRR